MAKPNRSKFKFRKHETIGATGAEQDRDYLYDCFVDTGDLDVLRDTENPKRVVLGRTGTGKTALLLLLQERENNVGWLEPDQLALNYLAGSGLVRRLEDVGVKLDVFFKLLWRHVLVVELIRMKYNVYGGKDQGSVIEKIRNRFGADKTKREALEYLFKWGSDFFTDTERRVRHLTETLESDVRAGLGAEAAGLLNASVSFSGKAGSEVVSELRDHAQQVVNQIQIEQLAKVIDLLAEDVFASGQDRFYVVIDRLDEDWVDEPLRLRLIMALLDAVKTLQKIRHAKIVVALRQDLLQRVFRASRGPGFQEEKYDPLLLRLHWTKRELVEVVDLRINQLVRRQYTREPVSFADLFPARVSKVPSDEYLVERTLRRPRDMIHFVNECIGRAVDKPNVSAAMVKEAEYVYSDERYRSLADEWVSDYPELLTFSELLKRRDVSFALGAITDQELMDAGVKAAAKPSNGRLARVAQDFFDALIDADAVRVRLALVFYQVGLVGIRLHKGQRVAWSFDGAAGIREAAISQDCHLVIAPMFHRVLGVQNGSGIDASFD